MPTAGFEQCADVGRHLCLVFLSGPNLFFLTFKGCIAIRFQVFQNTLFCWIFELLLAATPCFRWFHACWDWWYRWCLDPSSLLQRQRTGKNWFGSLGPRMEKMWWQERFGSVVPGHSFFGEFMWTIQFICNPSGVFRALASFKSRLLMRLGLHILIIVTAGS